jgi:hypothetical protein
VLACQVRWLGFGLSRIMLVTLMSQPHPGHGRRAIGLWLGVAGWDSCTRPQQQEEPHHASPKNERAKPAVYQEPAESLLQLALTISRYTSIISRPASMGPPVNRARAPAA